MAHNISKKLIVMYGITYFSLSACLPSPPHLPAPPAVLIWYGRGGGGGGGRPILEGSISSYHPSLHPAVSPPARVIMRQRQCFQQSCRKTRERDTVSYVTHTQPSSSPPPFSTSPPKSFPLFTYTFFPTSPSTVFISFSFCHFSYILSAVHIKCILLSVHLCVCTLQVMVCPVLAVHSDLLTLLCLQSSDATWTHSDRWGNSRERGVLQ